MGPGQPQDVAVSFALGSYALTTGDTEIALGRYETVVDSNPTHAVVINNLDGSDTAIGTRRTVDVVKVCRRDLCRLILAARLRWT